MSLHPAVAAVRRAVRRELADLPPGATVLVACSGGPDSLALLSAAVVEGHQQGLRVIGGIVDHDLQEGSAEHTQHVVQQMAALGVDETASARVRVDPGHHGPEAAAREARYAVLGEMADRLGVDLVLLGHTQDDQAETVLLGLTRGSGGRSLAGMRRGFGRYRRPLLDVTRTDTVTACQVEGLAYWNDPHNVDPAFTRVRVRRKVLPLLEDELGPGVAATLARTADQLREDMDLLDEIAATTYAGVVEPHGLRLPALAAEPPAIVSRVLRLAAVDAGAPSAELFHVHVQAMVPLVRPGPGGRGGGRQVQLPGKVTAYREGDHLRFRPTEVTAPPAVEG